VYVVATAGHVDHGKSTLVRALTGMEPDRWAEERRRGMTIDLGFAWTVLPSGRRLAFVDVPGHQRFIANMLAGVGPAPAVLFVVAADEGWRRQSTEHLAAIDALGVRHGVLAVTRADLADPAAATAQARERIAATSLGAVEALAVSGQTDEGLADLRAALDRMAAGLPPPVRAGRVRLWVDRAFTVRGSGTVVTGTLGAGTVRLGDEMEIAPGGSRVRVRGLESLGQRVDEVGAVARVALNLRGPDAATVARGAALLTPGAWWSSAQIDVRLSVPPAEIPAELVWHVGSAGVPARVRPLGKDTARLTLAHPLPLAVGDRGLLRNPGAQQVAAGALVLDVAPPALRRRGAAVARAGELAGMTGGGGPAGEVRRRGLVRRADLVAMGVGTAADPVPPGVVCVGSWVVDPSRWHGWQHALVQAVHAHDRANPMDVGLSPAAARRLLDVPDAGLVDALVAATPELLAADGRIRRPGAGPAFPPPIRAALEAVTARLGAEPFAAPEQPDLDALGLRPPVLAAAAKAGLLLRLSGDVVLLPSAEDEAVRRLRALDQPFALSAARTALATTRRVAVPLLEHLDARGRTRRLDGMSRMVVG
jgi:selenocysteine-specific elongation factor